MKTSFALLVGLCLSLTACGDEGGGDDGGGNENDVTTFACENVTCDFAAGEFCWFQRYSGTGESHSATCVAPATACTTCDCAADAVAADLDGSNNCDSVVSCSQDGDAITYACTNPAF